MEARRASISGDRDTTPYWAALAKGALTIQHCRDCGHWTWPPRLICSGCHGENLEWTPTSGEGEVYSWVVSHRPGGPDYVNLTPYIVALVRLAEQPDILIPGRLITDKDVHQGMKVRAAPETVTDEIGRLNWVAD
jgi:uncharacterized OB-fold protein